MAETTQKHRLCTECDLVSTRVSTIKPMSESLRQLETV